MTIIDIYSKRLKESHDVYIYNEFSEKIRIQINFIVENFFKKNELEYSKKRFNKFVFETLTREHEIDNLYSNTLQAVEIGHQIKNYLLFENDIDKILNTIEVQFKAIEKFYVFLNGTNEAVRNYPIENVIKDLNIRFRENGLGFKFQDGIIIKINNELLHNEITIPVFSFLKKKDYVTINKEFIKAYEHYRHGDFKECLNTCLKALDTTLKFICDKKGWRYNPNNASSKLIQIVFKEKLVPEYLQSELTSLRATLEGGVPTIKNRNSEQGNRKITVDESLASYTLNLTGSSIKFLIELYENSI